MRVREARLRRSRRSRRRSPPRPRPRPPPLPGTEARRDRQRVDDPHVESVGTAFAAFCADGGSPTSRRQVDAHDGVGPCSCWRRNAASNAPGTVQRSRAGWRPSPVCRRTGDREVDAVGVLLVAEADRQRHDLDAQPRDLSAGSRLKSRGRCGPAWPATLQRCPSGCDVHDAVSRCGCVAGPCARDGRAPRARLQTTGTRATGTGTTGTETTMTGAAGTGHQDPRRRDPRRPDRVSGPGPDRVRPDDPVAGVVAGPRLASPGCCPAASDGGSDARCANAGPPDGEERRQTHNRQHEATPEMAVERTS